MDYNPRKSGIGSTLVSSKDSPRSTMDPSKSGRGVATALGRPSPKDYKQTSHDHVKSASKDYSKLKDDAGPRKLVTTPQLKPRVNVDRNSSTENVGRPQVISEKVRPKLKDDIERDILNQSLRRTQASSGGDKLKVVHKLKDDRERDILKESLKRTQDLKVVQKPKVDRSERDILNQSLKRTQVSGAEDLAVKHEKPREALKKSSEPLKKPIEPLKRPSEPLKKPIEPLKKPSEPLKKPSEPLRKPSATRPEQLAGDVKKASSGHVIEKAVKKETASTKDLPEDARRDRLSSDRKRPAGVKAEDGKVVRVRSVTKIIEPVRTPVKEVPRSVKVVTTSAIKAKQEKTKRKSFSLPGQRFEAPEERDALRLFYGSLHRQIPTSDMANIWLMEHGLLEADEAQKVLTHKVKSKSGLPVKASQYQAPTPSRFSNGSTGKISKFRNENFLDIKPVSKKLKL